MGKSHVEEAGMTNAGKEDTARMRLTCPDCGWSGRGSDCVQEEFLEGVVNRSCPTCARLLVIGEQVFAWRTEGTEGPEGPEDDDGKASRAGED
jgi:hypothetical protein